MRGFDQNVRRVCVQCSSGASASSLTSYKEERGSNDDNVERIDSWLLKRIRYRVLIVFYSDMCR